MRGVTTTNQGMDLLLVSHSMIFSAFNMAVVSPGTAWDQNAQVEQRPRWPSQAPSVVAEFIRSVQLAAQKRQLLAILTGPGETRGCPFAKASQAPWDSMFWMKND